MRQAILSIGPLLLAVLFLGCSANAPEPAAATEPATPSAAPAATASEAQTPAPTQQGEFSVSSSGIADGVIADAFGARGEQTAQRGVPSRSFALSFQNIPQGTACLALSMIDPDGGDWVHWLAAGIPAADLPENASVDLAGSMAQGQNSFGFTGYGGPTPPSGTHSYVVTVYALDEPVDLENGFSLEAFLQAIDGKVLASAVLTGDYSR